MRARDLIRLRRPGSESGQATTEFALILFPLLILVVGVIQFGIGLNYWLDMQRIANQGARWAAVNNWPPDCTRAMDPVNGGPGCPSPRTLQETLKKQVLSIGLKNDVSISICYPDGSSKIGDPVKVHMTAPFGLLPILGGIKSIDLVANATMRLEQTPTLITGTVGSC